MNKIICYLLFSFIFFSQIQAQNPVAPGSKPKHNVTEILTQQEYEDYLYYNDIVIIFYYTIWCVPCIKLSDDYEYYSRYYKDFKFLQANVDEFDLDAFYFRIEHLPTIIVYKYGKIVNSMTGGDEEKLKRMIREIL